MNMLTYHRHINEPKADFNIYRKDRGGYGGILTAIHTSIYSKLRPDLMVQNARHNEIIVVELIIPISFL